MGKITKLLRSRRGVTLVELIVTMALFTIITAATAALLTPTLASYAKANELAELNTLMDTLVTELSTAMAGIDQPPQIPTEDIGKITLHVGGSTTTYFASGGLLHRQLGSATAQPVLQAGYYKNKQLALVFDYDYDDASKQAVITTTLTLTLSDGGTLERTFSTKPLLLNQ